MPPGLGSDRQGMGAAGVMGVKTALALGAEQVGGAHVALPKNQVQVRMQAFRTRLAQGAEGGQVHRIVAIDLVDDDVGIELGEQKAVAGVLRMAAAMDRVGRCRAGRCFKGD